jgi:hypothetical protein
MANASRTQLPDPELAGATLLAAVNPAATTAGLPSVAGRAQLVDGKRKNKVSLPMRHLAARTTYLWHVHEGTCAAPGPPVPGWTYRPRVGTDGTLKSRRAGTADTRGSRPRSTPIRATATP